VALGLAETKDRTIRVESTVAALEAAMADVSAKVEDVRREVVGLRAELSDRCPKVKKDLTNLEPELAKLKEEMSGMRPKPEVLAPLVADVAVRPIPKAVASAWMSLNSPPSNAAPPPPKIPLVKVFPPPAPPKRAKQFPLSIKKVKLRYSGGTQTREMSEIPDAFIASGLPSHLGELIAVVGLRGGSRVAGGLSPRGLANVAVRDWSDDFTFNVGDHLLRRACHVGLPNFIGLMRRSPS
jgi:hypothetical protein